MRDVEQLEESFAPFGIRSGSELYLPLIHAKRLVEECSRKAIAVVGVDFVRFQNGAVIPSIPINSADWSAFLKGSNWNEIVERCNRASLKVLNRELTENPEQFCSMMLVSMDDWKRGL